LIRKPPDDAGATGVSVAMEAAAAGKGGGAGICISRLFASGVPSTPQTGQAMVKGIWRFTGWTSNLYFWPQLQTTFSSIIGSL
jgi:hypothetical protein